MDQRCGRGALHLVEEDHINGFDGQDRGKDRHQNDDRGGDVIRVASDTEEALNDIAFPRGAVAQQQWLTFDHRGMMSGPTAMQPDFDRVVIRGESVVVTAPHQQSGQQQGQNCAP